jgi:hypothetical protein
MFDGQNLPRNAYANFAGLKFRVTRELVQDILLQKLRIRAHNAFC